MGRPVRRFSAVPEGMRRRVFAARRASPRSADAWPTPPARDRADENATSSVTKSRRTAPRPVGALPRRLQAAANAGAIHRLLMADSEFVAVGRAGEARLSAS